MAAKSAARRRAPPRNAFLRLRRREVFGRVPFASKIYAAIPARLASPVATLVDAPRAKLLECVLLGFTADGDPDIAGRPRIALNPEHVLLEAARTLDEASSERS